jgi:hypothetical protein
VKELLKINFVYKHYGMKKLTVQPTYIVEATVPVVSHSIIAASMACLNI